MSSLSNETRERRTRPSYSSSDELIARRWRCRKCRPDYFRDFFPSNVCVSPGLSLFALWPSFGEWTARRLTNCLTMGPNMPNMPMGLLELIHTTHKPVLTSLLSGCDSQLKCWPFTTDLRCLPIPAHTPSNTHDWRFSLVPERPTGLTDMTKSSAGEVD